MDAAGNATVVGFTNSLDLPLASPLRASQGGSWDAFVVKLNATATAADYSTYFGATGDDRAEAVALDGQGNAYVAGLTTSSDFPTTTSAQPAYAGGWDAFVAKLTDTGNHPPVVRNPSSIAVNAGQTVSLPPVVDPDGGVTVSATGLPAGSTFDPATGAFSWTPGPTDAVAWWKGEGNANDSAGSNNPSATNAISFVPGKVGQGITFGTGWYVEIPDSPALQNQTFTLEGWVRPDGAGPNNDDAGSNILVKNIGQSGTQGTVSLGWSAVTNRFNFTFGNFSTDLIVSADTFAPGQFYHVAATYD